MSSFDRLFPSQDEVNEKGIGNLISLPYQGKAMEKGNTLMMDPKTGFKEAFENQFRRLNHVRKVSETQLEELLVELDVERKPGVTVQTANSEKGGARKTTRGKEVDEGVRRVQGCLFLKWCRKHPNKVTEPLWFAMISNLARLKGGYSLCHEYSKEYRGYSKSETDDKIHHALDTTNPHTCRYIRENGFD